MKEVFCSECAFMLITANYTIECSHTDNVIINKVKDWMSIRDVPTYQRLPSVINRCNDCSNFKQLVMSKDIGQGIIQ